MQKILKNILLTGATGYLGSRIYDELTTSFNVIKLSRSVSEDNGVALDLTDHHMPDPELFKDIDVCIHLASYNEYFDASYPYNAFLINIGGTLNLLERLVDKGLKQFIYFSTFHVYGKSHGLITETSSTEPKNHYALTHLLAEEYVKLYCMHNGVNYQIIRLTNSFGAPPTKQSDKWYLIFNDFVRQAHESSEIVINGNSLSERDFIPIDMVCQITSSLVKNAKVKSGIYNMAAGRSISLGVLANEVASVFKREFGRTIKIVERSQSSPVVPLQVDTSLSEKISFNALLKAIHQETINIVALLESK